MRPCSRLKTSKVKTSWDLPGTFFQTHSPVSPSLSVTSSLWGGQEVPSSENISVQFQPSQTDGSRSIQKSWACQSRKRKCFFYYLIKTFFKIRFSSGSEQTLWPLPRVATSYWASSRKRSRWSMPTVLRSVCWARSSRDMARSSLRVGRDTWLGHSI